MKYRIVKRTNVIKNDFSYHVQRWDYVNPKFSDMMGWKDVEYINHDGKLTFAIFSSQAQAEKFIEIGSCAVTEKVVWEGKK